MSNEVLFAARAPQGVAVMDARRGRGTWRFLDPIGARLWLEINGGTAPEQAVDDLTAFWSQRGAKPEQVRADLRALVADLDSVGLLDGSAPPAVTHEQAEVRFAAPVATRPVERAAGHAGLLAALALLRLLPVRYALAAARAVTRLPGSPATTGQAEAVFAAVRRAASWWPGRVACLEESLAAHFAAALTGHQVRWVVGARFTPQGAHAWIEAGGAVIGQEEGDRIWPYTPALTVERSH